MRTLETKTRSLSTYSNPLSILTHQNAGSGALGTHKMEVRHATVLSLEINHGAWIFAGSQFKRTQNKSQLYSQPFFICGFFCN